MSRGDNQAQLLEKINSFFRLNPDESRLLLQEALELAGAASPESFQRLSELTGKLIEHYLVSPAKRAETATLHDYFTYVDKAARLLAEQGEITRDTRETASAAQSVALVDRRLFSSLDWCRILSRSEMPKALVLAADACQRRNHLVTSVVEYMFLVLQEADLGRALAWQLDYLDTHRGQLDADIVRDLISAWKDIEELPSEALDWVKLWSADENLLRQWPAVVMGADRLLRTRSLRTWLARRTDRNGAATRLGFILKRNAADEKAMLHWLESAIGHIGRSVQFFVEMSQGASNAEDESEEWRRAALFREIKSVEALFPPVLIAVDLILPVPDGAYRLALALFGLIGRQRTEWGRQLEDYARRVVRRAFIRTLRVREKPQGIIEQLSFGDPQLRNRMLGQLDWVSQNFDSLTQREKVVKELAVYYASYREPKLVAIEVARRYRDLMRLLHEDNLRRLLTDEQYAQVEHSHALRELAATAADARRFLARRRALDSAVEEMVAAELDFGQSVRRRRLHDIIQWLEGPNQVNPSPRPTDPTDSDLE